MDPPRALGTESPWHPLSKPRRCKNTAPQLLGAEVGEDVRIPSSHRSTWNQGGLAPRHSLGFRNLEFGAQCCGFEGFGVSGLFLSGGFSSSA